MTRKQLIKDCDILWSKIIRSRAGQKCQICGLRASETHHIAGRGMSVRFSLGNGLAMCRKCHNHDFEEEMEVKISKLIGENQLEALKILARLPIKLTSYDLAELKKELTKTLKETDGKNY